MELNLSLKQSLNLSPQMIQSMEVLQMGAEELSEYIEKNLQENPALEVEQEKKASEDLVRLGQKLRWLESANAQTYRRNRYDADGDSIERIADTQIGQETLYEHLMSQLRTTPLPRELASICAYIAGSLDQNGYLDETPQVIAYHLGKPTKLVERALSIVQALDPPGVAAGGLAECLQLQLRRMPGTALACVIAQRYLDALSRSRYNYIARELHEDPESVKKACDLIRTLTPRPGSTFFSGEESGYVIPDLIVSAEGEQLTVSANDDYFPAIRISAYYCGLLQESGDAQVREYLSEKIGQAKNLVRCIEQRRSTLLTCAEHIVRIQEKFFRCGSGYLKPMTLSDIAECAGVHESTVSRAIRGKYIQCGYGVYSLSDMFSRSLPGGECVREEAVSPDMAKSLIRRLVDEEDKEKPLSDQKLAGKMVCYGVAISRRTVAKYRDEMGIPAAAGRKK